MLYGVTDNYCTMALFGTDCVDSLLYNRSLGWCLGICIAFPEILVMVMVCCIIGLS